MKKYLIATLFLSLTWAVPARADVLGEQHTFNTDPAYDSMNRTRLVATMRGVSDRAYFYVEDSYWNLLDIYGRAQLMQTMDALGSEFDTRIYPKNTQFYGTEPYPGIDGDSRITFVLAALRRNVGGYFDSTNEYKRSEIANSNEREMIFLNASQFNDTNRLFPFIAHEFQHMISFNQKEKIRGVGDDVWLNEMRSEYTVNLLGYDSPYIDSNFNRRVESFIEAPSDSVTEWKNLLSDYGVISVLAEYIAEHWNARVLGDTLLTASSGIVAVNESLRKNGSTDTFDDVFRSWMIANVINDTSLGSAYGYTHPGLRSLRIVPTQIISDFGDQKVVDLRMNIKDWEQRWYDIQGLSPGTNTYLNIAIETVDKSHLRIPYVAFKTDGSIMVNVGKLDSSTNQIQIADVGSTTTRVILMPYKNEKLRGFSSDETPLAVTLRITRGASKLVIKASPTPAGPVTPGQFGLTEGDFIRATGDNDIYIVNAYGYKRIVLSPAICLQYAHLGARGCFGSVKIVTPEVRDAFHTSPFYSNGYTNDGKVYMLVPTGEDTGYLENLQLNLTQFAQSIGDSHMVFFINNREQAAYRK